MAIEFVLVFANILANYWYSLSEKQFWLQFFLFYKISGFALL